MGKLLNTNHVDTAEAFKIITGKPFPGEPGWKNNIDYIIWIQTHIKWWKRKNKWEMPHRKMRDFHNKVFYHAQKRLNKCNPTK